MDRFPIGMHHPADADARKFLARFAGREIDPFLERERFINRFSLQLLRNEKADGDSRSSTGR